MDEYAALHLLSLVLVPFFLYLFSSFLLSLVQRPHPTRLQPFGSRRAFWLPHERTFHFFYTNVQVHASSSYRTVSPATSNEKKEKRLKRSWLVLLEDLEAVGYSFEFIEGTLRYGLGGLMKI